MKGLAKHAMMDHIGSPAIVKAVARQSAKARLRNKIFGLKRKFSLQNFSSKPTVVLDGIVREVNVMLLVL